MDILNLNKKIILIIKATFFLFSSCIDGIDDQDINGKKDVGEKKVYFEFSDYSTSYIFYERN